MLAKLIRQHPYFTLALLSYLAVISFPGMSVTYRVLEGPRDRFPELPSPEMKAFLPLIQDSPVAENLLGDCMWPRFEWASSLDERIFSFLRAVRYFVFLPLLMFGTYARAHWRIGILNYIAMIVVMMGVFAASVWTWTGWQMPIPVMWCKPTPFVRVLGFQDWGPIILSVSGTVLFGVLAVVKERSGVVQEHQRRSDRG